jgi:hypothetical protein
MYMNDFFTQLQNAHQNGNFAAFVRQSVTDRTLFAALPVFADLANCPQDPRHHPEGDVLAHILLCCDCLPTDASFALSVALLFHDVGKLTTTVVHDDGHITANGHEDVSADMTSGFLTAMGVTDTQFRHDVLFLVRRHMCGHSTSVTTRTLRRLVRDAGSRGLVADLLRHGRCDVAGRGFAVVDFASCDRLTAMFNALGDVDLNPMPTPALNGDAVMALTGLRPGPQLGRLLADLAASGITDQDAATAFVMNAVR